MSKAPSPSLSGTHLLVCRLTVIWPGYPSPRPALLPVTERNKARSSQGMCRPLWMSTQSLSVPLSLADPDCPSSLDSLTSTVCSPPAGTLSANAFSRGCEAAESHLQGMQFSTLASNPEVGDPSTQPLPQILPNNRIQLILCRRK